MQSSALPYHHSLIHSKKQSLYKFNQQQKTKNFNQTSFHIELCLRLLQQLISLSHGERLYLHSLLHHLHLSLSLVLKGLL